MDSSRSRLGVISPVQEGSGGLILCYAQALGIVVVGSLLVELSEKMKIRSGRPSRHAAQGQNHGVRRGYEGSRGVRQSA